MRLHRLSSRVKTKGSPERGANAMNMMRGRIIGATRGWRIEAVTRAGGADFDGPVLADLLDREIESRERRSAIFGNGLFRDPAWDILLDLARAELAGERAQVSSTYEASRTPDTTALRYLRLLVEHGYVRRASDPLDKRRAIVRPTSKAMREVAHYLRGGRRRHSRTALFEMHGRRAS